MIFYIHEYSSDFSAIAMTRCYQRHLIKMQKSQMDGSKIKSRHFHHSKNGKLHIAQGKGTLIRNIQNKGR